MLHAFAQYFLKQDSGLSDATKAMIDALPYTERQYEARESVYLAGDTVDNILIVKDGWFASSIDLRDGGRQLLNYYVPIDIVGLEFVDSVETPTGLTALSASRARLVPRKDFVKIMKSDVTLTTQVLSLLGLQDVLMQERLCAMSRMTARDRIAYFLLSLRSKVNAKTEEKSMTIIFPLTQTDIADSLGLTNVTVSRSLTELEQMGYLKYSRNIVEFIRLEMLAEEVAFTDRYAKFNSTVAKSLNDELAA